MTNDEFRTIDYGRCHMPTNSTAHILHEATSLDLAPGHRRFIAQLSRLLPCLKQAAAAKDPALALYGTPARQWFFYLQALCRIYRDVQDKKPFKALGELFKAAEDQLGKVDYWDGWLKDSSSLSPKQIAALEGHKADELARLSALLKENDWLSDDFAGIRTIIEKLADVEWHGVAKDRREVADFLRDECKELDEDFRAGEFDFAEVELGVHEFRRKLRWLSIYAQALDGLIQLRPVAKVDAGFRAYMTKATLESRFNILPAPQSGVEPLYISAPLFYAMSWVITEIGGLKDAGLKVEAMHQIDTELGSKSAQAEAPDIAKVVGELVHTFIVKNEALRELSKEFGASAG